MAFPDRLLTAQDLGLSDIEDEEALDVLDLPQLYTKPSAKMLLSTLSDMSSEPPSWETTPRNGTPRSATPRPSVTGTTTPFRKRVKIKSEGLPAYLTRIISSPLAWIDDEEKEQIWVAASQRLSERSGRTAMGAISRSFVIPLSLAHHDPADSSLDSDDAIEITLHEPALTADNLGLKTWASSYLLAKRMAGMQSLILPLPGNSMILELGAGTGLVGITVAAVYRASVTLTDLPAIVPNLEHNALANASKIATFGAKVHVAILDWSDPSSFQPDQAQSAQSHSYGMILAADPIYSSDHPRLLVQTIEYHLSRDSKARVCVEMPLREAFGHEREDFRQRMHDVGLHILKEGEEVGYDDWASNTDQDDLTEVSCWWSIWSWR